MRWTLRTLLRTLLTVILLFLPALARAQAPTSYTFKVFNQGAPSPLTTTALSAGGFTCGLAKVVVVPPVVNPVTIAFDDPADGTKECRYTDPGTGPLLALPFGLQAYTATLAVVNSAGTSADSTVSNPFSRPGVVGAAPVGVRVR